MPATDPTDSTARDQAIKDERYLPRDAEVTGVHPHSTEGDESNHGADVRILDSGQELRNVPVYVGFHGETRLPREGETVLVGYKHGDPPQPYIQQGAYTSRERAPIAQAGEWSINTGGARISVTSDGEISLQNADGAGLTTAGATVEVTGDSLATPTSSTVTPGELPDTDPSGTPQERASQAGFDIQNTVQASSTSDITGAANTLYVVDGTLTWDGTIDLGGVDDTAICGQNNAVLPIPEGFREDYAVHSGDAGSGFMWSGIDIDQTAPGAYGRIYGRCEDRGFIEYVETSGTGRRTDAEDITDEPIPGDPPGPWLQLGVTSQSGTSRIKNCVSDHAGVMADTHEGDRPSGINLQPGHRGTLNIVGTRFEGFPNNAIYCSNINGSVNIRDCQAINCGVAGFRIARGTIENSLVRYDYTNSSMDNADAPNHGVQGMACDQDIGGGTVEVTNCTAEMLNVASCGGGFDNRKGHTGTISGCTFRSDNVGGAPDIILDGRCDEITNCTLGGAASDGTAVVNRTDTAVAVSGNTFNYPSGRGNYSGPTS